MSGLSEAAAGEDQAGPLARDGVHLKSLEGDCELLLRMVDNRLQSIGGRWHVGRERRRWREARAMMPFGGG